MLTIRLQRTGTRNKSSFRIVLAEAHRAASKKYLEVLGHYNPRNKDFGIKDQVRLEHWLAQNVLVSPTVYNLLVEKKLVEGKKVKAWQSKKKVPTQGRDADQSVGEAKPAAEVAQASATEVTAEAKEEPQAVKPSESTSQS